MLNSQIIAILAAILFPVFARAREKARQTSCLANVKQIGLGIQMYIQDYDEMLPMYRQGSTSIYWDAMVAPYLKNTQILKCPSRMQISGITYGWYYHIHGATTTTGTSLAAIDSPSEVCWIMDSNNRLAHFPPTTAVDFEAFLKGMNDGTVARAPHNEGLNLSFVDGHAKWSSAQAAWDNGSTYWPWP